jgi:hypothetical protein
MRDRPSVTRSSGGPYRAASPVLSLQGATTESEAERDLATALAFVWATAALRFVIVCARHESLAPDPAFAAILTFGIPALLFGSVFAQPRSELPVPTTASITRWSSDA